MSPTWRNLFFGLTDPPLQSGEEAGLIVWRRFGLNGVSLVEGIDCEFEPC